MCWNVDPETNQGTCAGFCVGNENDPHCDHPGDECSISGSGFAICLPTCDPLAQDCPEGEGCWGAGPFFCAGDASGDMGAYGDPCEFVNVCDPVGVCSVP
jgi:hypothetical protein